MGTNRSTIGILGALIGLIILILVIYAAVGNFRQGAADLDEQSRVAGRPITLAETISGGGEEAAATDAITGTVEVTGTVESTETVDVAVAETVAVTETTATTDTVDADAAAAALTTTDVVTETAPVTATTGLTATELPTTTAAVATDTTTSESASITTTAVITAADELTATAEAGETPSAAAPEASAEVVAIVTKATCFACHVIPGVPTAVGQVGPNLTNIGATAATRIPGYTAEQYLRESLLTPNAFVAPECPTGPCLPNLMVQNLGDTLSADEIDTIVAYLASLGTTAQ